MIEFLKWVQELRHPLLDIWFVLITMLGEDYFFMLVMATTFWCVDKGYGYRLGFAYLSSAIVNGAIKETFRVPRPFHLDEGIIPIRPETATGYSFPSGHTQCAASLWTSLAIYIRKHFFSALAGLLIMLTAMSRVYLGVHTPLDVVIGAVVGITWVFVANWLFERAERSGRSSILLLFLLPMVVGFSVFRAADYIKAAATTLGFLLGYFIEPKYIRYDVRAASLSQQLLKVAFGMVVLLVIHVGGKSVLGTSLVADFTRYFLIGSWVTIGAPLAFGTGGRVPVPPFNSNIDHK